MYLPRMQESILSIAKPMEAAILQGATVLWPYKAGEHNNSLKPLQFVHFSDVHAILDQWDRIMTFTNHYKDYLSFALHTGDYCGGNIDQYVNLYGRGVPCELPAYNCVGNHDKVNQSRTYVSKETVHS